MKQYVFTKTWYILFSIVSSVFVVLMFNFFLNPSISWLEFRELLLFQTADILFNQWNINWIWMIQLVWVIVVEISIVGFLFYFLTRKILW